MDGSNTICSRKLSRRFNRSKEKNADCCRKKLNQEQRMDLMSEEEKRLEKLVLGGTSSIFESIGKEEDTGEEEEYEKDCANLQFPDVIGSQPAWEDEDDQRISVKEAFEKQGRGALYSEHSNNSGTYYETLKRKFETIVGTPKWAKLGNRSKNVESDDEEDERERKLLQTCGNFISKERRSLHRGILEINKVVDLNNETSTEGPIITAVEFHPTSTVALVAGQSGVASLFQVDGVTNAKMQSVHFKRFPIYCARFSRDGQQFVIGSQHHSHFFCYDMMEGRSVHIPMHHALEQTHMKNFEISPDGGLIAVCGRFGNIHLLSGITKEYIGTLKMNSNVSAITFNPDGSKMYSHGDFGEVYQWDLVNRCCTHRFFDDGSIGGTSIAISQSGQMMACGSTSGAVNIYEMSSIGTQAYPKPSKILLNLVTPITCLRFNPTSEILAMTSDLKNNAIKMVHFPSMTVFSNFPRLHEKFKGPKCVNFSPSSGFFGMGNLKWKTFLFRLKHYGNY